MTTIGNKLLLAALDEYVTGHEKAKKALIVMLSRSVLRAYQRHVKYMDNEYLVGPMKVMLLGASGTGKSYLLHCLQKASLFPMVKIDATQLNPTGASGGVKVKDLQEMICNAARVHMMEFPYSFQTLQEAIDRTVVHVDEFDKIGNNFESSGNWNKHVQSNFLTMFDNKDEYAGVSYVFTGAFSHLQDEVVKNSIGFTNRKGEAGIREAIDNRIIKSGLIPEIIGRVNAIVELDKFTKNDLFLILKDRILPKKQMDLAAYGVFNIKISKRQMDKIAQDALDSGQGVRYLQRAVDDVFLEHEFDAGDYLVARENYE